MTSNLFNSDYSLVNNRAVSADLFHNANSDVHAVVMYAVANNSILGTTGNDVLVGTLVSEVIEGGAGNDKIDNSKSKGSDDTLNGGDGNDTMTAGTGGEVYGGAGDDVIVSKGLVIKGVPSPSVLVDGGDDNDIITGGAGNHTLNGGLGDDKITAGAGATTINGGAGIDIVKGGALADVINGGDGNDKVQSGAGNDVINGDAGNDRLDGDAGNDTLNGGDANDYLFGDAGDDVLIASAGNDSLIGGAGNDTITLSADLESDMVVFSGTKDGIDTVSGFEKNVDKIAFSGTLMTAYDDIIGTKGVFNFATTKSANFTSLHEGWIVNGNVSNSTDMTVVANLLMTGNTLIAGKGADGLIAINSGGNTFLYNYIENGTAVNHIVGTELTLLGTITASGGIAGGDIIFATIA